MYKMTMFINRESTTISQNLLSSPSKFYYINKFRYETIRKVIFYIKGEQVLWNDKFLNESIFGIFERIVNDMKADWIFYQIDYLYAFNQILSNGEIQSNKENKKYINVLTSIVRGFFAAFEKNQFLLCEPGISLLPS